MLRVLKFINNKYSIKCKFYCTRSPYIKKVDGHQNYLNKKKEYNK